ncbi:Regulator of chromosome condensation, partial [Dissostichus eleginoides]
FSCAPVLSVTEDSCVFAVRLNSNLTNGKEMEEETFSCDTDRAKHPFSCFKPTSPPIISDFSHLTVTCSASHVTLPSSGL